jgi:hypothetical protein
MSGAKQNALSSSAQDLDFRDGKRLVAVSREFKLINAGAPSPSAQYLEEELNNLSKGVNRGQPTAELT